MSLRTVHLQICDACLSDRRRDCSEPGCFYSSPVTVPSKHNPLVLQINGYAMCCACRQYRASRVDNPGTEDERQYCQHCWGVANVRHELYKVRGFRGQA